MIITWKTILKRVCDAQSETEMDNVLVELNKKGYQFSGKLEEDFRALSRLYNRTADSLYGIEKEKKYKPVMSEADPRD